MPSLLEVNYLVEGVTDAAVARTLIRVSGATPGIERIMGGKSKLLADLHKYNAAAVHYPSFDVPISISLANGLNPSNGLF